MANKIKTAPNAVTLPQGTASINPNLKKGGKGGVPVASTSSSKAAPQGKASSNQFGKNLMVKKKPKAKGITSQGKITYWK